jgi:hypothetical protein
MGGRRRLRGGFVRFLPDHRAPEGVAFRRYLNAALEIVSPLNGSESVKAAIRAYAIAGVVYDRAAAAWAAVVRQRDTGRGRRPSEARVERFARRLGLADGTLSAAMGRLEELARAQQARRPVSVEDILGEGPR